jgi:hypothetical protein
MQIWHYHPDTGRLLGTGAADPSPVEPDVWLIPAFATATPPPAPDQGQEVAYVAGEWVQRPAPPPPAAPEPPAPEGPPAQIRVIAPFAFRQRLPAATRRAVTLAASQAMEAGDATLQTWLDDLSSTRVVLLDHPDIASGVAMLRAAGLVTEAEATALLADGTAEEV